MSIWDQANRVKNLVWFGEIEKKISQIVNDYLYLPFFLLSSAIGCKYDCTCFFSKIPSSNGNASETKANESFDNGVFFDIEAKRTPSIASKLFSKQSEHIR